VDACGLVPIGMTKVHTAHGTADAEIYLVSILLPNHLGFVSVQVTKADLGGSGFDVLIGMDIITRGDFSVTNKDNRTIFSYRWPSQTHIDFVAEHEARQRKAQFKHGGNKKDRPKRHKTFGKNKKRRR
jgi:hypothetical protein